MEFAHHPRTNVARMIRVSGAEWVDSIPRRAAEAHARWGLTGADTLLGGHNGVVIASFQGERPVIVKLVVDPGAARREVAALRALPPGVGPELLDFDGDAALLLEHLLPGTPLHDPAPVTRAELCAAAELLARLHATSAPAGAGNVALHWTRTLAREDAPGLELARTLFDALSEVPPAHLHGDAHLGNIVRVEGGLRLIDPELSAGDPAYDLARLCVMWAKALPAGPDELAAALSSHLGYDERATRIWARLMAWNHARYLRRAYPGITEEPDELDAYATSPL